MKEIGKIVESSSWHHSISTETANSATRNDKSLKKPQPPNVWPTFMEKNGVNRDGVITRDELVLASDEAAAAKQTKALEKYDQDGDGTIYL
ncbi:MAG: hypothetical protein M2R45_02120 [Verrucomicrobia subdivision 3 bacterium]|nr:hypothetical protein [Limisphaerales bacterium]MCS1413822.1 hypothetical protein [Limisphaerales bacterium]